jgi:dipeptidyl aminopeptidase/acylaminoacyl peptidase
LDLQSRLKVAAPYGSWSSPISAELVARAGTRLTSPLLRDGTAWWLESRADEGGRVALVQASPGEQAVDAVPPDFGVRSLVHDYGGGSFCIEGGVVYCTRHDDQRLYRIEPGAAPVPITPDIADRRHRYADGVVTPDGRLWIGVRERYEEDAVDELVAVPSDGSAEPRVVAAGRDFYAAPRVSPDGLRLAFLAWDLPWMPWDGCELFVADLAEDATIGEPVRVAGRIGQESIWQPEWSPAGDLVFASDRSGWWNLERIRDGEREVLHAAEAEFGYPAWSLGNHSYGFLDDGRIVAAYDRGGRTSFAILDPDTGALEPLDVPHDAFGRDPAVSAEGSTALLIAGAATIPNQVVRVDVRAGSFEVLRSSSDVPVDSSYISEPRAIEFPTEGDLTAHALVYAPANPEYEAPGGEAPPLRVVTHGGPTGNATPILDLEIQFWTSRGFAVVDVNYGGSTGYGRAYRERLNGEWGVVDLRDCVSAARYLVEQGEADPARLLVTGSSAGGYTTMCALTFTDVFAAGTSTYGIADLERLVTDSGPKFERGYLETLVGPYPERAVLYRERSPINAAERITTPLLLLQGADDEIVPPVQSELVVQALAERGIPHVYLLFEGEGHGFRKAETTVAALEAELSFYAQVLGFDPGNPIPKLHIEHLAS